MILLGYVIAFRECSFLKLFIFLLSGLENARSFLNEIFKIAMIKGKSAYPNLIGPLSRHSGSTVSDRKHCVIALLADPGHYS
ncbi:hypothetical protein GJ496_007428 [Pomphorhynchus laevis]|nr:hypothetical protein GJ496_007428 [Pomphorhynchus laevis]